MSINSNNINPFLYIKNLKKIFLYIILFSFTYPNNFHAQCTNSTTMCSSITSENDSICEEGNVNIEIVGGTLGPGSKWELFIGGCSGTLVATTETNYFLNVFVDSTTTFYCKADSCDTSSCVELTIHLLTYSEEPTSLIISNDTLCSPGNVDFTVSGGSRGTLALWELHEDSCDGNLISTSNDSIFSDIFVEETKSYYVNAKGFCDTTNCAVVNFNLATSSQDPTSLIISDDTVCIPGNIDFTVSGGSLGTLALWELHEDSCDGNLISTSNDGNFSDIVVNETKNYYVNANGFCNSTNCVDEDIFAATSSIIPDQILFSNSIICNGENLRLHIQGGSLGTLGSWNWYTDACGGNLISQEDSVNIFQNSTTHYYLRAEGYCNNTNCLDKLIITPPDFIELDSISRNYVINIEDSTLHIPDSICPESPVKLFAHFDEELPSGYSVSWYKNSCEYIPFDVGDSITVYPDSTTTYYARVIGTCGASLCKSITIYTKNGSLSPTNITASINNFCTGQSTTLNVNGGLLGSEAQWSWYLGSCSGTAIGNGDSITVTPASTNSYFVRATGGECGNSECSSILINTHDLDVYHSPVEPTCEYQEITLEGGFPEGGNYSGNGVSGNIFDPAFTGVGTHTIYYSYTDDNNCTGSIAFDIDILPLNPDPISLNATSYEICNGNSTIIWIDTNSNLINGSKWVWYKESCATGDVIDLTENLDTLWINQDSNTYNSLNYIQVSPNTTTNYYVRSEGGECPPSNCIGVTVDVYTLETHLNEFDSICGIYSPSFDLTGGDPSGGVYSGSGVYNNIFNPESAGLGEHTITYTYSIGNCVATDNETIKITKSPIKVNSSIEQETCSEGGIMIHIHAINGGGFYNYQWSDGTFENPLTYANTDNYSVLVADGNNCYTFLENIEIDSSLACIEMVNTFSPNSDGLNDVWELDFSNYENANLTIFNKWGNVLAEFNQTIITWDATYEGNDLPSGTYYYILKLTESSGNEINQSGPITILR